MKKKNIKISQSSKILLIYISVRSKKRLNKKKVTLKIKNLPGRSETRRREVQIANQRSTVQLFEINYYISCIEEINYKKNRRYYNGKFGTEN